MPDHHPTKDILPVSLRKGDESSQPEEQPEDILMWVENTKLKLFGHLLAQQIADNYSIDSADGVEPVQSFGPAICFTGSIIIEEKKKALQEAKRYRAGSIMWVDGSKIDGKNAGAIICWKDRNLNSWKKTRVFPGKIKEILDAELWAIANGLKNARKITLKTQNTPIMIFSDSREALTEIRHLSSYTGSPFLRNLIYQRTLDLGKDGHFATIR